MSSTNVEQNVPPQPPAVPQQSQDPLVRLLSLPINNENDALNVVVSFLNIAQRRGVFSIDESAKIWDAIKVFQKSQ